ncbi:heme NO-binding domain-containing protein [Legionella impletisoli]|uniref:Guanylate cyclase n=1 Tax=Legionella impletisoli TaxID=343510 RepID=A0A917JTA5_9GAMM|nr:heme NO-binding domain-containing protein [Legionella impletisoli]GGI84009.1 guanylate cyclase [Legionella impletisoli]
MKGMIFTQFLTYVEQTFSYEMVDRIICQSHLKSKGAYTSIGTYDPEELMKLVHALSLATGTTEEQIIKMYGEYLFGYFIEKYPTFIKKTNTFEFLCQVESHIHHAVKKYYPDSELPSIQCTLKSPDVLILNYSSSRPLADLAEGLIRGCIRFHNQPIEITREDLSSEKTKARFILTERKQI